MQILITHGTLAKTRVLSFNRLQLAAALVVLVMVLMALSGTIYHAVFLKAAREGWPVVSQVVRLVVRDEFAQRDRFMRENLDAMAQKVGEMQAKLVRLAVQLASHARAPGELQEMGLQRGPQAQASQHVRVQLARSHGRTGIEPRRRQA